MGYSKPYAKKCKYCNTVQVVWDESLEGPNKFKEVENNIPHSRDRCDAAKNTPAPVQQQTFSPPKQPLPAIQSSDIEVTYRALVAKVDNLNFGIAKIMSMLQTKQDLMVDPDDVSRLRTENAELRQIEAKRKENFVPANQMSKEDETVDKAIKGFLDKQSEAEHVQNMIKKGQEDEELEI